MSVNYFNSWHWIFMARDAPLTDSIFQPARSTGWIQKVQTLLTFVIHTFALAVSSSIAPIRKVDAEHHWQLGRCPLVVRCASLSFEEKQGLSAGYPCTRQPLWSSCVCFALIMTVSDQPGLTSSGWWTHPVCEHRQHLGHRCDWLTVQARRINPHNNTSFTKEICSGLQPLYG